MSVLLLGAGPGVDDGTPVAPSIYWSPTDIQTPTDFVFSNPNAITPLSVEQVAGAGSHIGRTNVGVAQGLGDKTFYVTANTVSGLHALGLANASETLNSFIGNTNNSIGYYTGGGVDLNGVEQAKLATWTTGDVIGVRVNTTANTVEFNKNGGAWSATISIAALGEVAIYPAHYSQSSGGKITGNFTGLV